MSGPRPRPDGGSGSERGCAAWLDRGGPVLALCLVLAFLVHGGSILGGFYNDDALFLNQAARAVHAPAALVTERPLGYFRPTWSAYVTAQWLLFGLAPMGYHVVGVALHGLTGFLVWRLARRVLRARAGRPEPAAGDPLPPLLAAAAFLCFFSHAEGVQWIAAHNSVLACTLCVAACLAHLRAVERGGVARGLLTALLVLLALLTKEPSAVLLAWLPLCELAVCGWRSPFTRASWGRWAAVAAAVAAFMALNSRVGQAFTSTDALAGGETRAAFGFITLDGALGATAWMFSPVRHEYASARAAWGLLALALAWLPVLARRRELVPAALLGTALLLTAMAPASMTRRQQPNCSRLYYFPTVGAALLLGTAVAALGTRRTAGAAGTATGTASAITAAGAGVATWRTPPVVLAGVLAYLGVLIAADWHLDRDDYRPISLAQTKLAEQLAPALERAGGAPVLLLEPWIDNIMHLQQFALLYAGVKPSRVSRMNVERAQGLAWLEAQRRAGAVVLDWDDERGLVLATTPPPDRSSTQGGPRGADAVDRPPRIEVMRIGPP